MSENCGPDDYSVVFVVCDKQFKKGKAAHTGGFCTACNEFVIKTYRR